MNIEQSFTNLQGKKLVEAVRQEVYLFFRQWTP